MLEDHASSQDITIQRCILISLDLIQMLILISKTVFILVCTPLVAIRFSASAQLVSSDLLFGHGGRGAEEVAQEGGRVQIDRTRQAKAQRADPNTTAISQAAAGTVDSK